MHQKSRGRSAAEPAGRDGIREWGSEWRHPRSLDRRGFDRSLCVRAALDEPTFLDIALVYALLNFLMAIAISKFTVERGGVL